MFGFGKKSGPLLGLDINSSTISVIEIAKTKTDIQVSRFHSVPTPPDIVREGLLADPEAVGNSVRELLESAGIVSKKGAPVVNIGIPGQSVVIRLMPVPTGMPPDELSDVVKQEAINNLPFPLEEANIDYCLLPATERTDPDGVRRVDVLLAAIQRIVVDSYWRMAEAAGVKLGHLDISSLAVIRSLASAGLLKDDGELAMAVNIRNDATDITLTKKGMPLFSRSVLLGVETLGEAISRSIDVPMDEAISLLPKMNLGSVPTSDPKLGQAAQVARSVFGDLIAEVGRSLEFYMSQVGIIQVDQVLITGPGSMVPGIDEFVSNRLNIPSQVADPFANLIYDKAAITDDRRATEAMLVGLVIDPASTATKTVEIDLNKQGRTTLGGGEDGDGEEEGEEEAETPWFVPTVAAGIGIALIVTCAWGACQYFAGQKQAELDELDQKVQEQQKQLDQMTKSQGELAGLRYKKEVLERIVKHGQPVAALMNLTRETIPQGVMLNSFSLSQNRFEAKGIALDFARASHYAINLQGTNLVNTVSVVDPHRVKNKPQVVGFEIRANIVPEASKLTIDQGTINSPPKPLTSDNAAQPGSNNDQPTAPVAQTTGSTK
ncbi:MAG TPA: type IV pilus assembly protein PilM [Candidatus Obscuribacterales bacterium]